MLCPECTRNCAPDAMWMSCPACSESTSPVANCRSCPATVASPAFALIATMGSAVCGSLPSPAAVLRFSASCSATFSDCASTVPLAVLRSAFSGDSVELSALALDFSVPIDAASAVVSCVLAALLKLSAKVSACLSKAIPAALSPAGVLCPMP
jgi:hypothetical protein